MNKRCTELILILAILVLIPFQGFAADTVSGFCGNAERNR
jgi:hypothetical protein